MKETEKIVSQYGHDALNFFDWFKWFGNTGAVLLLKIINAGKMMVRATEYYTHLSQPMTTEMFVRGRMPEAIIAKGDYQLEEHQYTLGGIDTKGRKFPEAYKAYENHQPLFEGEVSDYREESFHENGKDYIRYKFNFNGNSWMFKSNEKGIWKLSGDTWSHQGEIMNDFLTENKGLRYNLNMN